MKMLTVGFILGALLLVGTGRAHRLSGHPQSLKGKLALARAQVRHDRVTADPWLLRDRAYVRKLARVYKLSLRPAHYDGWICIHRREGAWNDPGRPYYGGLQMSWNWMSSVPGGDAGKLSPLTQMWIAERVSARYGFSWSWMSGQWPNTYPPCAAWF